MSISNSGLRPFYEKKVDLKKSSQLQMSISNSGFRPYYEKKVDLKKSSQLQMSISNRTLSQYLTKGPLGKCLAAVQTADVPPARPVPSHSGGAVKSHPSIQGGPWLSRG
jgi:hypothetical protein